MKSFMGWWVALLVEILPATLYADEMAGWEAYLVGEYTVAYEQWTPLARQGNPELQHMLGYMYLEGQGVERDYGLALRWFEKAVANHHMPAEFAVGTMYENGQGVTQDMDKALERFTNSARGGFVHAQFYLGLLYSNGDWVPQNYAEAFRWYMLAALSDDAAAQNNVALFYFEGRGVEQNLSQAVHWLQKAAHQGFASAQAAEHGHQEAQQAVDLLRRERALSRSRYPSLPASRYNDFG